MRTTNESNGRTAKHSRGGAPLKGRAATYNPANRFAHQVSTAFDDGRERPEDAADRPPTLAIREIPRTIISTNQSPDISFDQSINPYRGCEHGCIYCYARPTHAYWDMSPGLDFETRIIVKQGAADLLRQRFDQPNYRVKPIVIGANTDPYQPLEISDQITRELIEVMVEYQHPFSMISKSQLVLRDLDLLAPMAEAGLFSMAISVTTLDNRLKRMLEPRTTTGSKRLAAIAALTAADIPVTLLVAPMIPYINDGELETIMSAGREAGARRCRYILLRLPLETSALFQAWLNTHFPARADKVMSIIRQSRGGKDYDSAFGSRMTGTGQFAALLHQRWQIASRKLGFEEKDDRFLLDTTRFRRHNQQLRLF